MKNSRISLIPSQSTHSFLFSHSNSNTLAVPTKPVLEKFQEAMQKLQQDGELWRVDYLCITCATFELAMMQGSLTIDHISDAVETSNYTKIRYQFGSIGGYWELRVLDNDEMQGLWGDARLIVPIY